MEKVPENEPGPFYVDRECIDCDVCREHAPDHFAREPDQGYSYVYRQPRNAREMARCREALESCPVDAIGCDEP
ncbi:MAG: ferredoxin [Blastocatellia bacterium]|nr:ferredoxin [Blastocatellia bacterium]